MATVFVPEGSPLDDYFQDEAQGSKRTRSSVLSSHQSHPSSPLSSPERSTKSSVSPPQRTYPIFNGTPTKITSRHPSPLGLGLSSRGSLTGSFKNDVFGERFKYAICSSGILEKDYVPGLGTLASDRSNSDPFSSQTGVATMLKPTKASIDLGTLRTQRWDVGVAGLALVYGVYRLAGFTWLLAFMGSAVAVGGMGLAKVLSSRSSTPVNSEPPTPRRPKASKAQFPAYKTEAMACVSSFLEASGRLDNTIEKALSILQPLPPDSDHHHELRVTLHRMTGDMTDHIATATSSLTDLVDKHELAVLSDMYDIPTPGFGSSRRSGRSSLGEDDDDLVFNMTESWKTSSVPSPRNPRLSLSPQSSSPLFGSHPSTHSSSYPSSKRAPRHLMPMPSSPLNRLSDTSTPDDRFTSLPSRTPRFSKRASWGPDASSGTKLEGLAPAPTIRPRRLTAERKILENEDEGDRSSSSESNRDSGSDYPGLGFATRPISPSPLALKSYTPRRPPLVDVIEPAEQSTSRHTRTMSHSPRLPHTPSAPNPKRLSLQSMPYYPSSDEESLSSARLNRTKSMPQSDIQALRLRYATGSRQSFSLSKTPSFQGSSPEQASLLAVLTSPTPPAHPSIRRMVSISPLTLHSLKASCLGIHLKRRRVACCLLGLRFDNDSTEYWREVSSVVRILSIDIESEVTKLEAAVGNAMKEETLPQVDEHSVPWERSSSAPSGSNGVADFAPRTSDEAVLRERIDGLRKTLEKTWADLASVQGVVDLGELEHKWSAVRGDLGEMVREWERGKDVVGRMSGSSRSPIPASAVLTQPTFDGDNPVKVNGEIPEFIRRWADQEEDSASTSFETDIVPASLDSQHDDLRSESMMEDLPPPGMDVVFEADLDNGGHLRERSTLSREERIALSKAARAQGLTLTDLLKRQHAGEDNQKGEREAQERGGMVVDELKSMIGLIRARKGVERGEEHDGH